ncbi:MAG: UTP--glucose-1-phosphate uridylyltransferase [Thermoguttaceae bacterium]
MNTSKEDLHRLLAPYGQEHLLAFWDGLDDAKRESLAEQIGRIDFGLIARLAEQPLDSQAIRALADRATCPPAFRLGDPGNPILPQQARQRGVEALRAGQIGVILVAGGQGTRLGFGQPKGMFPIGPVSKKSLFQWHVEKTRAVGRRYQARIPLYLMTSPATHQQTAEYFARHQRFGLPADELFLFCQGTMPAVDARTGKVLLAEPHRVALSPDGHGGMLAALAQSGALADARRRGLEHFFYFQVDNPLVDICNPEFLGYHLLAGSEFSTQVVRKQTPWDRVGNVVQVDGRLRVIEYSDLPDDVACRRGPDGSLAIWAGSIAIHAMSVAFLERVAGSGQALPFHVAHKKVPYIDPSGRLIVPREPNAKKFEQFIFDLMPSARQAIIVEVDPAEHFAPLKNASGADQDTPEAVKARLVALHARWLRQAGVELAEAVEVELSPLFALDAEELSRRVAAGTRINEPTYFGDEPR